MAQTADNEQWVDLDVLSPKLVKEWRRQYDPSIRDEPAGSLGKGAARLKAFVRRTKMGLDIRLRRKMNSAQDEVTDIQLVADPPSPSREVLHAANRSSMSELPAALNEISELPDTSIIQELDLTHATTTEPLPRYDGPANTSSTQPGTDIYPQSQVAHNWKRSSRDNDANTLSSLALSQEDEVMSLDQESTRVLDLRQDASQPLFDEANQFSEGLQMLINSLGRESHAPKNRGTGSNVVNDDNMPNRRLKVANTFTYETETDAEPPATRLPRKKPGLAPKRRKSDRKSSTRLSDASQAPSDSDDEGKQEPLLRKRTVPRRLPASSGPEAIWKSLIGTQSKILGPEHPLVYRAKSDLAHSRANSHAKGTNDLSSLVKSEVLAIDTLGSSHPWVSAFVGDLEALQRSLGEHIQRPVAGVESATVLPLIDQEARLKRTQENGPAVFSDTETRPSNDTDFGQAPSEPLSKIRPSSSAEPDAASHMQLLHKLVTSFPSGEAGSSPTEPSAAQQAPLNALWNSWQPPHRPETTLVGLPRLAFGAAMGVAARSVLWLQRKYGPEPPVDSGKVRVRWTCSCGAHLFDDFIERRAGAARELEAYLNRPQAQAAGSGASPTSPNGSSGTQSLNNSFRGGPPSSQTSWSTYGFSSQGAIGGGSNGKASLTYAGLPLHSQASHFAEPPWLLTSTNEEQFTPKISHLDMSLTRIRSDKDLALSLREHYFTVNKKWWRSLRIRGLTTIEFVQFEVHRNRFADIRKSPDMPTHLHEDYSFEPADLLPPVGSQYLLHLFKHPEDYDGELITYLRSPKKTGRLHLGVGWGINLIEGFRADRVWLFVSGLFALGSLVFAVVWSFEKNSVQGASSVAAYIVSLGFLAVGWLQACLG